MITRRELFRAGVGFPVAIVLVDQAAKLRAEGKPCILPYTFGLEPTATWPNKKLQKLCKELGCWASFKAVQVEDDFGWTEVEVSNRPLDMQNGCAVKGDGNLALAFSTCPIDYKPIQAIVEACGKMGLLVQSVITRSENCEWSTTKIRFASYHQNWTWEDQQKVLRER